MTSLITAQQLKERLNKGLIIFDCRFRLDNPAKGRELYREGHIPGAYYLDLNQDLSSQVQPLSGRHPLPDWNQLIEKLRQAGVNQHSDLVLYDDSRFAYAARAWWLLKQLGLHNLYLLDGGLGAWQAMGGALDRRAPANKSGSLRVPVPTPATVSRAQLIADPDNYTLIDSRENKRYLGQEEPIDPIAGHIPGALNFPWQEISDEQGFFKPMEFQRAHWSALAGKQNLVAYCGSGVTACVNLLSLELTGINARLYPGSWSEWCAYLLQEQAQDKSN